MLKLFASLPCKSIPAAMVFYYAVARGRNPGVYATWQECKAEVNQWSKPIYKKFSSKTEAENFITKYLHNLPSAESVQKICETNAIPKTSENTVQILTTQDTHYHEMGTKLNAWAKEKESFSILDVRSQAVKIANELGIENYNVSGGWLKYFLECNPDIYKSLRLQNNEGTVEKLSTPMRHKLIRLERKILGIPSYSPSVSTRIEHLERTLQSIHQELDQIKRSMSTDASQESSPLLGNRKRKRVGEEEAFEGGQASGENDASEIVCDVINSPDIAENFDRDKEGFVNVYTDGACSGNGKLGAVAGIGVWFGNNHPLNISRPVTKGFRATNNVAEIQAVTEAAKQATKAGIKKLKINTDSQFLISCITEWAPKWKKNGWRKANGSDVINKGELIELEAALKPLTIAWNHVRGHAGIYGNEMADELARKGAAAQNKT